jgi:thiamine pyrophosphokinase
MDHTIANFQTLGWLTTHGARGALVGRDYIAAVLKDETLSFSPEAAGIISMFCLGGSAEVSIEGLHYPLEHGILTPDYPLGVSNHFVGKAARITVHSGLVLALWDRSNGLGVLEC